MTNPFKGIDHTVYILRLLEKERVMEFNTIKNHPDFVEVLGNMGKAAKAYERNMKIASALIGTGSVLVAAGLTIVGIQEQILKRTK